MLRCGNHRDRILRRSFLKVACMDVPFQYELGGWRGSVLADLDQETRRPDRAGEGLAEHAPTLPAVLGALEQAVEGRGLAARIGPTLDQDIAQ